MKAHEEPTDSIIHSFNSISECPCGAKIPRPSYVVAKGVYVTTPHYKEVYTPIVLKSKKGVNYVKYVKMTYQCRAFEMTPEELLEAKHEMEHPPHLYEEVKDVPVPPVQEHTETSTDILQEQETT